MLNKKKLGKKKLSKEVSLPSTEKYFTHGKESSFLLALSKENFKAHFEVVYEFK